MNHPLSFQNQCVRDLAWVMCSPSLLSQGQVAYVGETVGDVWCHPVCQHNIAWLSQLDDAPAPLLQWLEQRASPLLGIYFESLLAFWLQRLPDVELLAQNLLVEQSGLQLGEFDLLFRDLGQQQVFHWEVTVKFYLRVDASDYQWLGPNPRDSLQRKLNKVFDRQLRLSQQPKAQQLLLNELGLHQVVPQAFVKGYLFYPYDSDWRSPGQIPAGVSSSHLTGWWCHHMEVRTWLRSCPPGSRWLPLPRLQWLSAAIRADSAELMDKNELLEYLANHFSEHYQALLLAEFKPGDAGWFEASRGFVVNDSWPL
ncbi:MAG TPA: DUF1853 family protein [Candidatus Tenderia electrophaga]|uniref:DUF1853 family protein n=1 Tax=Candidatus Tenderia electrophaga TaxID=1748243 RepID=A0A832J7M8_9GAMM|nr:DUF1853 family protein [Candidatus Tenderia electrophaga]